jgi:hypothetical protein
MSLQNWKSGSHGDVTITSDVIKMSLPNSRNCRIYLARYEKFALVVDERILLNPFLT